MKLIYIFILFVSTLTAHANKTIALQSSEQQVALIELYTSEGCSSCPPADNWVSQLKTDPRLWTDFIPIAFHVDYWDYIGWKDRMVLPGTTQRQSQYKAENKISSVYTPGFVINGQEWQGWFKQRSLPPQNRQNVGVLKAAINGNSVDINYLGAKQDLEYHIVVLGFNIHSQVKEGENAGRSLSHDFVALSHDIAQSGDNRLTVSLPETDRFNGDRRAIVCWINTPDSLAPIQAVGGWL